MQKSFYVFFLFSIVRIHVDMHLLISLLFFLYRFSFQQDRDANRILKGVMRVGHLAKGLLLRGDTNVELVVLCADKPTLTLLKKVVELLPTALKQVASDNTYTVTINAAEAGLTVAGDGLTVLVQFTSPIMREQGNNYVQMWVNVECTVPSRV